MKKYAFGFRNFKKENELCPVCGLPLNSCICEDEPELKCPNTTDCNIVTCNRFGCGESYCSTHDSHICKAIDHHYCQFEECENIANIRCMYCEKYFCDEHLFNHGCEPYIKIKLKNIPINEYVIELKSSELKELFSAENVRIDDCYLIPPEGYSGDDFILKRINDDSYSCLVKADGNFKLKWFTGQGEPEKTITNVYLNIVFKYIKKESEVYQWGCNLGWVVSNEDPLENKFYVDPTNITFETESKYELKGKVEYLIEIVDTHNIDK
jgi:hypothetical protein